MKREEEMGRKGNLLSLPPPPFFILFCCRSNFGAITLLETLATPANEAQDLTTSNDNSLMIYQAPMSWAPGLTLSQSRCLLFAVKRKMNRSCKWLLNDSISMTDLTWIWFRILFCERMAGHFNLCSVNTMFSKCYISSICQKQNTIVTYLLNILYLCKCLVFVAKTQWLTQY